VPQLEWDELEFLEYLSVVPSVEEDAVSHAYQFSRDGLEAFLTIWQYESFAMLTIGYADTHQPLIELGFFIRGRAGIERHFGTDKPHLCFSNCIVADSRFAYRDRQDPFDTKRCPIGPDIRLFVEERITCTLTS